MSAPLSPALDRLPPQALDSEKAVLGCLLLAGALGMEDARACLAEVETHLCPGDFYLRPHGYILEAVQALIRREESPHILAVNEELKERGLLDACEGRPYLVSLAHDPPNPTMVGQFAATVRERSLQRRLEDRFFTLGQRARDGGDVNELLAAAAEISSWPAGRVTGVLPGAGAVTRRLADIEPEAVCWLWPGRIPLGKLTILDGDPGLGKSLLTLDLAARVSAGKEMPDGYPSELGSPAGVILMTGEDGLADTVKPRLVAAGADCTRIVALEGVSTARDGGEPLVTSAWLTDLEVLEEAIASVDARLLVVDPLMAFIPAAFDSHNDQQVRAVLTGLVALANRTGCAIVLVRHLNKTVGGNPLYRGGGSIGIVGAARSGLLVAPDPRDEEALRRVLASTKSNLAAPPASLSFRVEANSAGVPTVCWDGPADMDARELLGAARPLGEAAAAVLDAFVMDGEEVTPLEMALRLKRDPKVVKTVMWRLAQKGLLVNHGGKYSRA